MAIIVTPPAGLREEIVIPSMGKSIILGGVTTSSQTACRSEPEMQTDRPNRPACGAKASNRDVGSRVLPVAPNNIPLPSSACEAVPRVADEMKITGAGIIQAGRPWGIFLSYISLCSCYNFDNWAYQPSSFPPTPHGISTVCGIQIFPTEKLKIE